MPNQPSSLSGTWKLVSLEVEYQVPRRRKHIWGADPVGYLILTPGGRMMALVAAAKREHGYTDAQQAGLFRTMLSYTGPYRIEGNRFITTVDVSWNEIWTGTEQERFYEINADRLEIVSAWTADPREPDGPNFRAILTWRREDQATAEAW